MADEVPFKQERKCFFFMTAKEAVNILSQDLLSNKLSCGNFVGMNNGFVKQNSNIPQKVPLY